MTDPSGLQQLGARFYWPEIGRFISQDPIGDGVNWYAYVGNSPVVYVDPEGLVLDTVADAGFAAWDVATALKCPTWQNVGYATVSVAALALPFVPNAIGYARHADDVVKFAAKFEKHHTVPREVLKTLPDDAYRAVRGRRGAPNRWPIPQDLHRGAHKGPGGGAYNAAFKARLQQITGGRRHPTAGEVSRVRDEMVHKFGMGSYRP